MHIQTNTGGKLRFGNLMLGLQYDSAASGLVLCLLTVYSGQNDMFLSQSDSLKYVYVL